MSLTGMAAPLPLSTVAPTYSASSHASTSSRSPILHAKNANTNAAPTAHSLGIGIGVVRSPNAPPSPSSRVRGGSLTAVHLPAQPTVPTPITLPITNTNNITQKTNGYTASTRATPTSTTTPNTPTGTMRELTQPQSQSAHVSPSQPPTNTHHSHSTTKYASTGGSSTQAASQSTAPTTPILLPGDWQQDSSVTACHHCSTKFSLLTRKHHCRSCGLIHCDSCSKYRSTIPSKNYQERVRVCGNCYHILKKSKRTSGGGGGNDAANSTSESSSAPSTRGKHTPNTQQSTHNDTPSTNKPAPTTHTIDELESQLTALQSLHSSYQPEHHYLTSLLSNSSQLESSLIATIQVLYAHVTQQHQLHQAELRTHQSLIASQQRQIEHLEEIVRTGGASGTHARSSRGASPVPNSNTPGSIGHPHTRAASPSIAANPSSRAFSPAPLYGLTQLTMPAGAAIKTPTAPAAAVATPNAHTAPPTTGAIHTPTSMPNTPNPIANPLPPLPFALTTPAAPGVASPSGGLYDAASESAYIDMSESHARVQPISSSLVPSYRPVPYRSSSLSLSSGVISVTEPPSPPHDTVTLNTATATTAATQPLHIKRSKRASSNPNAATPNDKNSKRSTRDIAGSPSVHKLLDEVGM